MQALGDHRRHRGVPGIVPDQFLDGSEFLGRLRLLVLLEFRSLLLQLLMAKFGRVWVHDWVQASLAKAAAMGLRARCILPRTASAVWLVSAPTSW